MFENKNSVIATANRLFIRNYCLFYSSLKLLAKNAKCFGRSQVVLIF